MQRQKAVERLRRILPSEEASRALRMVACGWRSALHIASVSRPTFLAEWLKIFPEEERLGLMVHQNAIARRAFVALHHARRLQHLEPHYRAARFR